MHVYVRLLATVVDGESKGKVFLKRYATWPEKWSLRGSLSEVKFVVTVGTMQNVLSECRTSNYVRVRNELFELCI